MPNLNAKLLRDELAKIIGGTWPRRRRGSGANKTLWGDEAAREAVGATRSAARPHRPSGAVPKDAYPAAATT